MSNSIALHRLAGDERSKWWDFMRKLITFSGAALILLTAGARADRPVTEEERTKLQPSIAAAGCSGGKVEFDDGQFEVEDATCEEGRIYDLKFDQEFRLIRKKLDD
jgi:hypothetical protein